jgi:hypothetical protein
MLNPEIAAMVESGEFVAVGEYRMSKAEMINWRDKTTGQAKSAPVLRHTVEFGTNSVQVAERVPDSTKIEDIRVPFKKGEGVLMHFTEMVTEKGVISCRGRLEKVVPIASSPSASAGIGAGRGNSRV